MEGDWLSGEPDNVVRRFESMDPEPTLTPAEFDSAFEAGEPVEVTGRATVSVESSPWVDLQPATWAVGTMRSMRWAG